MVVAVGGGAAYQLSWAVYSLATLTAIGGVVALTRASDSPILVGVFTWALGAVADQLTTPITVAACKTATGSKNPDFW